MRKDTQTDSNSEVSYFCTAEGSSCYAYYILTLLYVVFMPSLLLIMTVITASDIGWIPLDVVLYILSPLFAAVAMFLYAYYYLGRRRRAAIPNSILGTYLPIMIDFAWQFLIYIMFNIGGKDGDAALAAIFSLNFFGIFSWSLHVTYLMCWGYNAAVLVGFIVGERLAARRTQTKRRPLRRKRVVCAFAVFLALICFSEGIWGYRHRNIVKPDPQNSGYGFAYEDGLSSTDLKPYYVENEQNILARLDTPSSYTISNPTQMPVLDGAEAAYPVYSAFAYACYEDIDQIQEYARQNEFDAKNSKEPDVIMPVAFHNSIIAYENLLDGSCDIFFGAKPSVEQQKLARWKGNKELVLTPIAKEAFVFFVNRDNPVDGLTSEQIRDIYSGKIHNWKSVGGKNKRILPFQRPENSGSQTMMKYFMGDVTLKQPLETEYVDSMEGLIVETARYQNKDAAIGYSFRYFASIMASGTTNASRIKYLSVDGVYPDTDMIQSGAYPITTELYAITIADNPNPNVEAFLEWIVGPQGQQIVSDTGYVALPDHN